MKVGGDVAGVATAHRGGEKTLPESVARGGNSENSHGKMSKFRTGSRFNGGTGSQFPFLVQRGWDTKDHMQNETNHVLNTRERRKRRKLREILNFHSATTTAFEKGKRGVSGNSSLITLFHYHRRAVPQHILVQTISFSINIRWHY